MSPEQPHTYPFPETPNPDADTLSQPEETYEWLQLVQKIRDERRARGVEDSGTKGTLKKIIEQSFIPEA